MTELLKRLVKGTPLYHPLRNWVGRRRAAKALVEWERNGRPVPPPHIVKQRALRSYAKRFGLRILVETGTLYGDMIEALKDSFDRIYSIELSDELYREAKKRFKGAAHIELIHGDSGVKLKELVTRIDRPALFWLDGHYSGGETAKGASDTPVYDELRHILNTADMGHVITIDDARHFGSDPAYPSIAELRELIAAERPELDFIVEDDIIRITPRATDA
jgi:hypothetical protein